MMEQYKQNRGLAKGSLTRILTFCQNPAATEAEIQVRVNKADEYFQQFETIQAEIEREPHTVDQANEYEKYRQQVEQIYYTIKAINVPHRSNDSQVSQHSLNTLIETIVQGQNNLGTLIQNMTPSTTSTPILQNSQPNGYRKPKLPQITIPEFDGQYTNWIRFRDLFESMIHNRADLSNVEKIEYLLGQLKGDALSVIRHITPSNDNYIPAWELIKKKYDDSESIKRAYLELLFDQSKMKVSSVVELNRLINKTHESVNALKALNEPIAHWDTVLIFHLERKLDAESHTLWCRQSSPFFEKFTEFLEQRLQELERRKHDIPSSKPAWQGQRERTTVNTSTFKNCPACKGQQHPLYNCNKFMTLPVNERIKLVRYNKMCYNCLQGNHQASECTRSACKKCNLKHNTLLHREVDTETSQVLQPTVGVNTVHKGINRFITVLPTARICIQDGTSEFRSCRALLDTGAQITLLSEACAQRLNIKRTYDKTALHGVGQGGMSYTNGKATIVMQTALPNKVISTVALCLTNLTQYQPAFKVDNSKLEYFNTLTLADPEYNSPGQVDLILGADILSECLLTDKIIHPSGSPCALATIFGWVIMGRIPTNQNIGINIAHVSEDLSDQLRKFWEIEELQDQKEHLTTEEQEAEDHYKKHFTRHIDGKYVVRLPFKTSNPYFGQTKPMAIKRFNTMEARFHHNNQLRQDYCRFMDEFIDLKHMELKGDSTEPRYYLPHHAVLKPSSTTTKLRVVFDGSAKGSNGMSLNEQLLIGPTIQNDLITILLQFRKYKVAMCSDIEKMYRQIIMHEKDRPYQCIVWRKNEEVETYCLNTVTYGTSAAPFLAIRTLKQIALDNCATHPMVSEVINNCFYVDDLMCSVPSESDAIELKNNLNAVLVQAQLHLRKWSSNADGVLRSIDVKDRATSVDTVIDRNKVVKTLGVLWDTSTDVFKYSVNITAMPNPLTKRTILSTISKIFDPLGWLAPVVITMKLFMQVLWLRNIDWDTVLPADVMQRWEGVCNNLTTVTEIHIPRWLQYSNEKYVELHGYADASELAFAAVIYLKVVHDDGKISTRLVASKTRVAPVKQVTLPRLELCAAHLAAKLLARVRNTLNIQHVVLHGWSDSTIVLAWLSDHPRRWKNFVANRTSHIISILPSQYWHHVRSAENPADLATRGLSPAELVNSRLWWQGPTSLQDQQQQQHDEYIPVPDNVDMERRTTVVCQINVEDGHGLINRYSNYNRLLRITALIIRFVRNCQPRSNKKVLGRITTIELQRALITVVKLSQGISFESEVRMLTANKALPVNHKLSPLLPFIDENGLLRVGGRLVNAEIPYDQKYPVILHKDNKLTALLITYYHLHYLHAGSRQLQYLIGLKYWIPSITYAIKRCVYKCTICMRYRSKPFTQQMGNLPKPRLMTAIVFQNVGVDFAGPMLIRSWKGRGTKLYKCWVSLFVCLATKAVHLELVTALSSEAFIATLRRFIARRGKPVNIYSDNGTNFVGCNKQLNDMRRFLLAEGTQDRVTKETGSQGINWHFSPPSGPHFGGLWEAGVKSMKNHLNRVLHQNSATYEELNTVLCQVEACLNSRPLCAKFQGDLDPLTPAHFLIHRNMESILDENYTSTKINLLTRWQYLQQLTQTFWKKWSNDYLKQLQSRPKWAQKLKNVQVDDLVIIKDDQLPPTKWSIGRVVDTHPGADGLVRVVTIFTKTGTYKRPVHKLCPLFVDC